MAHSLWQMFLYTVLPGYPIVVFWAYAQYRDIRTTMRNIALGAVETNPSMIPYVKKDNPWLMARGKLINGAWVGPAALILPFISLVVAWRAWSIWQSVMTNQEVEHQLK